jgi:hypothetical protein
MCNASGGSHHTDPGVGRPPLRNQPPPRRSEDVRRMELVPIAGLGIAMVVVLFLLIALFAWSKNDVSVGSGEADQIGAETASGVAPASGLPSSGVANSESNSGSLPSGKKNVGAISDNTDEAAMHGEESTTSMPPTGKPDNNETDLPELDPVATPQGDQNADSTHEPDNEVAEVSDERQDSKEIRSFNTFSTPATGDERVPIESALTGRQDEAKQSLLEQYGGGEDTEAAVQLALEWLARNQLADGSWSLRGPYSGGGQIESNIAATAMAMMAFEGAGNTPAKGPFKDAVRRGVQAMIGIQGQAGDFAGRGRQNGQLYAQAQATIALCELYGMTKSRTYRHPAQLAIDYAVRIQSPEGGWRYEPGNDADTSVTGWFVMALQSGLMAELNVPLNSLQRVNTFLDSVSSSGGSRYAYHGSGNNPSLAMTAEALLCRQYLGWRRSDERLLNGIAYLETVPLSWDARNVYCWYYATQVMHNMEGTVWTRWNNSLKPVLLENQTVTGPESGSWDHIGDPYGQVAGRLYTTCLCVWILETYYRHLPIYSYRLL